MSVVPDGYLAFINSRRKDTLWRITPSGTSVV